MLVYRSPEQAGKTEYCLAKVLWENLIKEVEVITPEVRTKIVPEDPDILVQVMARIIPKTTITVWEHRRIKDVAKEAEIVIDP